MPNKKVIAVVGATGAQGSGLADAILSDKNSDFTVRAITRNPDSEKARALAARGAEVVAADLDDVASLERAFAGAYGGYFVTNFWEHFSPDKEKQQAHNMATAAKQAGLQHVIWSTLEDTREQVPLSDDRMPTLMGSYKVPHFDAKGESDRAFTDLGVPTTFYRASFYWENLLRTPLNRGKDRALELVLPMGDKKLSGVASADVGRTAYGIFKKGPSTIGQVIGVAGDELTGHEMAAELSRALGEPVRYVSITPEVFRSLGFPGAEDMGNMFQYYQDFAKELMATRSVSRSRELNPALQSFSSWAATNAANIPKGG